MPSVKTALPTNEQAGLARVSALLIGGPLPGCGQRDGGGRSTDNRGTLIANC